MAGIIPTSGAGGVIIRDAGGECLALETPPQNAYCPAAEFTSTCEIRYLPSNCDARITPAQINAFESELICLAETLNPAGSWNCGSVCNLSANFTNWLTSDVGFEGSYLDALQVHLCARPFVDDIEPFPDLRIIACDGEGNIVRIAPGSSDVTTYSSLVVAGGNPIGTITNSEGTDFEVQETITTIFGNEVDGSYQIKYINEAGTEFDIFIPLSGGGCCITDMTYDDETDTLTITTESGSFSVVIPAGGGGGIPEAPNDGNLYGRENEAWVVIPTASGSLPLNSQVADYTLVLGDAQSGILMDIGVPNQLTVPANASVAFPVGTAISVAQLGAGQTEILPDVGVTVRTPQTLFLRTQYSQVSLLKIDTDEWLLIGDLEEL